MGNTLKLGFSEQSSAKKVGLKRTDAEHGTSSQQEFEDRRRRSKFLIVQNVLALLLAVAVLVTAFITAHNGPHDGRQCAPFIFIPIISVGSLLLFFGVIGLVAAIVSARVKRDKLYLMWECFQLLLIFCLVIFLLVFAIFSLEVTNKGLASHVTGYGQSYREYRLFEYPFWMQHRVKNANYWTKVKACIQRLHICQNDVVPEFSSNLTSTSIDDLTPIEKGCCIPPSACNISFVGSQRDIKKIHGKVRVSDLNSATVGSSGMGTLSSVIHAYTRDCSRWNSNPYQLCYDCDTCKAGVLQANMDTWKNDGILYVVLVMIIVMVTVVFACCGCLV